MKKATLLSFQTDRKKKWIHKQVYILLVRLFNTNQDWINHQKEIQITFNKSSK